MLRTGASIIPGKAIQNSVGIGRFSFLRIIIFLTARQHTAMKVRDEALGGVAAGVVGTVIGYPLDLVKTRMQTAPASLRQHGMFAVGSRIVRKEGILALYKGMTPPLISLTILNTTIFTVYSEVRSAYGARAGWDVRNALAGATAAPVATTVSTIENFIKTQMQLDNIGKKQYRGSLHCLTSLVKANGIPVLYTGTMVNMNREIAFLSTYFYSYEGTRQVLLNDVGLHSQLAVPMAGGISGALGWFISFPLDCIRAGVQGQPIHVSQHVPRSAYQVARTLLEQKGIFGLYSGVTPSIARAFLVSGSRFSAYEFAIYLLTGHKYHDDD